MSNRAQAIQKIKDIRDELYRRKITKRKLIGKVVWSGDDAQLVLDAMPVDFDYDVLKQIAAKTRCAVYVAQILLSDSGEYRPGAVYFSTSSKLHNNLNVAYQGFFGDNSIRTLCNNDYTGLINIPDEMVRVLGEV